MSAAMSTPEALVTVGVCFGIPLVGLALFIWFDLRMARIQAEMFKAEMEYYRSQERLLAYNRAIRAAQRRKAADQ